MRLLAAFWLEKRIGLRSWIFPVYPVLLFAAQTTHEDDID